MRIKKSLPKGLSALLAVCLLVVLDQFTKYLAVLKLKDQAPYMMIPGVFQLRYLENRGSAFGMMQNRQFFLLVVTVLFLALLIWFFLRLPETKKFRPLKVILVFVLSGAVGNMIDRVRLRYVIDFFYFELIDFPIFNVADIYITVSGILFFILFLFYYKEEDFHTVWGAGKKRLGK